MPCAVLSVPGHTAGSIALHVPGHGFLITGDIIGEHDGSIVLGPFNTDRPLAWTSLQRLAALDLEAACFGHGTPFVGAASTALRGATDPLGSQRSAGWVRPRVVRPGPTGPRTAQHPNGRFVPLVGAADP